MKIKKDKSRGRLKSLSKVILGIMTVATLSAPIQAFAHNAYFLGITVDTGGNKYMGTVAYDDNSMKANNHKEAKIGGFYKDNVLDGSFTIPEVDLKKMGDGSKSSYNLETGNGDKALIYTFPSIHTRALTGGCATDASSKDMDRAYWVNDTLVGSLNDAIQFVMNNSDYKQSSSTENTTQKFMNLAVKMSTAGGTVMSSGGSATFEFNAKTFTVTKGYDKPAKGLVPGDYIKISADKVPATPFVYDVPKGYYDETGSDQVHKDAQPLNSSLPEEYKTKIKTDKLDVEYLSWKHIVLQGNYNYVVNGTSYSKVTEILKPDKFTQAINDLLNNIVGSIRSILGLYSLQELMLNQGVRSSSYYYGIMPNSWYISSVTLHYVCQAIAWSLIIGALVKLLIQRNFASINTSMRVNLMEGIQNILLTGFLLTLIIPLFSILASLNARLVNVFGHASLYIDIFGSSNGTTSGLIGGIILNILYFVIMCYFNFIYIVRGITVALLFGTAPLFVCSIAFGGKYKQLFGNFLKELVTNIYLQTFHAICLAFFATVSIGGSARGIESIVLIYSFIPLTQFFRTNLMGLSGDAGDKIAGNALSTGASLATGFISGATMGNKQGKAGSGAGAGAGGSAKTQGANSMGGGIQTKSSDKLRSKADNTPPGRPGGNGAVSSNIGVEDNGGAIRPLSGDAKDTIPNAQLTKFGKAKETLGNVANSSVGKAIGGTARIGAGIGKMAVGTGMAIAGSAVGSNQLVQRGVGTVSQGAIGAMNPISSGVNSAKGKMGEAINNHSHVPQNEGFMYSQDNGNGTIDYKHGMDGLSSDTGIASMTDTGSGIQYELGGRYNEDSNTFEFGNYKDDGAFVPNETLNGSHGNNINEMLGVFASDNDEAKDFYKKQGITDVGYTNNGGNIVVSTSKGHGGINRVSTSGNSYVVNKNNTAPVSMKEAVKVPSYAEHNAKVQAQEQAKAETKAEKKEKSKK